MTQAHPLSCDVADLIRSGHDVFSALLIILGGIHDGSAPSTSAVLADLQAMGAWSPTKQKRR